MKYFGLVLIGLLVSAGAYATDGCPALTGTFSGCTVTSGNGSLTGNPSLTFTQSVNASGQTVYQIHQDNGVGGAAPSDTTIAVNGTITQTTDEGQGVTITQVITTTCSNQTVEQSADISINGAAYGKSDVTLTLDASGNLVYSASVASPDQNGNMVIGCKKQ